jgi:hypothetical protein
MDKVLSKAYNLLDTHEHVFIIQGTMGLFK